MVSWLQHLSDSLAEEVKVKLWCQKNDSFHFIYRMIYLYNVQDDTNGTNDNNKTKQNKQKTGTQKKEKTKERKKDVSSLFAKSLSQVFALTIMFKTEPEWIILCELVSVLKAI